MTREEEIHEIGNTINSNIGKEIDEDYNCADIYDFTIGFECGAKWADEHPNLYNDEKYQTVKVSQLDELNRKAKLYDELIDNACEKLDSMLYMRDCGDYDCVASAYDTVEEFVEEFRKYLEE